MYSAALMSYAVYARCCKQSPINFGKHDWKFFAITTACSLIQMGVHTFVDHFGEVDYWLVIAC